MEARGVTHHNPHSKHKRLSRFQVLRYPQGTSWALQGIVFVGGTGGHLGTVRELTQKCTTEHHAGDANHTRASQSKAARETH